jgi:fibronectin type 3 domain-containing protein
MFKQGALCPRSLLFVSIALLAGGCNQTGEEPINIEQAGVAAEAVVVDAMPVRPNSAILQWDEIPLPNIRGYRVYYGPDADVYLQLPGKGVEVGRVTSHTITGLTSGQRYYFAVTAVDGSGNESELSNQVFKDIP